MVIDISDIMSCENKEITKEVSIGLTSFLSRLGEFPITKSAPIDIRIANRENKRLLIQGVADLTVSIPCSRCLEEVPKDIHFSIDKELKIEDSAVADEDMEDIDYLIGLNLDIDKFVYGEILVNWPMKVLQQWLQRNLQSVRNEPEQGELRLPENRTGSKNGSNPRCL